jgi:N-acetylmuramoyl-L-alanine amidase
MAGAAKPRMITARRLELAFANLFGELGPEFFVTGHYSAGQRAMNAAEGVARVRAFHADHKAKGWGGIGYHYVIPDDGALICARPTRLKGAHTALHNSNNIGVNMPGTTGDRPTTAQRDTYRWLLDNAHTAEMPAPHRTDRDLRTAKRRGHHQWPDNATLCPGDFLHMYLKG